MTEGIAYDHRWLFVRTCQDLVQRSKSKQLYDKLRMAPLLRHLLVGERALTRMVAHEAKGPLIFWFREPGEGDADAERWNRLGGFDASRRETNVGEVRRTELQGFLDARCGHFGQWFTVQQFIDSLAHVYSGMYGVTPEGITPEGMAGLREAVELGGAGPASVTLQQVTGVALRALVPLSKLGDASGMPRKKHKTVPDTPAALESTGRCPFSGMLIET